MAGSGGRGRAGSARAATAASKATSLGSGVVAPNGVTLFESQDGSRGYSFSQGGNTVKFRVSRPNGPGRAASVDFAVNNTFLSSGNVSTADGARIATRVRSIMRADAASRPDGFTYRTSAASGDGLGARRAALYNRIGFSRADVPGLSQFAVVRNGRLTPLQV